MVLGFSSGLPLYVIISLLTAYLRVEGTSLKDIGIFSLLMLPYNWKFIWSPLLDRFSIPYLGRRRGWILISQLFLVFLIAAMGFISPGHSLMTIAILALSVAFFSANQDIAIDAFRRELLSDEELGLGNSIFVNA